MIRIKFDTINEVRKEVESLDEYRKFDSFVKFLNMVIFVIILVLACAPGIPIFVAIALLLIFLVISRFSVPSMLVDIFIDCPCKVKDFNKEFKRLNKMSEKLTAYEHIMDEYIDTKDEAVVLRINGYFAIKYIQKKPTVYKLPAKWDGVKSKRGISANIDFDNNRITPI